MIGEIIWILTLMLLIFVFVGMPAAGLAWLIRRHRLASSGTAKSWSFYLSRSLVLMSVLALIALGILVLQMYSEIGEIVSPIEVLDLYPH